MTSISEATQIFSISLPPDRSITALSATQEWQRIELREACLLSCLHITINYSCSSVVFVRCCFCRIPFCSGGWIIPSAQERDCYDFYISFCLCYGFVRLTTLEDLSFFSVGGNFCLYPSVRLGVLCYHLVPIILFNRVTMANIITITEVPSNLLKPSCILLYYFQGWNNNTI